MGKRKEVRIGCHVGISGGLTKALKRGEERGCDTIQIFISNPRGWRHTEPTPEESQLFHEARRRMKIDPVIVHTIYLINLATPNHELWENSVKSLTMNVKAAASIGAEAVVTHLGSHLGEGESYGIARVISAIKRALEVCPDQVSILLETTAGAGNGVGQRFEHFGEILKAFSEDKRVGICFDTCHVFAAGYDLRSRKSLESTLKLLDTNIGWERVKLVHANDSKGELGSHLDRHEHIGEGKIGLEAFKLMLNHPLLFKLPWILETPENTVEKDVRNLSTLRSLIR